MVGISRNILPPLFLLRFGWPCFGSEALHSFQLSVKLFNDILSDVVIPRDMAVEMDWMLSHQINCQQKHIFLVQELNRFAINAQDA